MMSRIVSQTKKKVQKKKKKLKLCFIRGTIDNKKMIHSIQN